MEANALHDLTAAYALDALDPEDVREYEMHLARCERCRAELASLSEAATALAYATEAPAPPPELRARILQQASRERSNVVPLRPRWTIPVAAVAAAAACVAIGLGIWAAWLSGKLDRREEALARQQAVAQILARPDSRTISFAQGTLVVARTGEAALVLKKLEPAGSGLTYEAWVADEGAPRPAGLFDGGEPVAVPLERPVRAGATVMVTKEKAGGVDVPTQAPFVTVRNTVQS
jgi:predicted anti-sigma-YlaC factor YlaD